MAFGGGRGQLNPRVVKAGLGYRSRTLRHWFLRKTIFLLRACFFGTLRHGFLRKTIFYFAGFFGWGDGGGEGFMGHESTRRYFRYLRRFQQPLRVGPPFPVCAFVPIRVPAQQGGGWGVKVRCSICCEFLASAVVCVQVRSRAANVAGLA